jgi:hypothetical protein
MSYCRIEAATKITVPNHRNLMAAWKLYGGSGLVGSFVCEATLTASQAARLPSALRSKLSQ